MVVPFFPDRPSHSAAYLSVHIWFVVRQVNLGNVQEVSWQLEECQQVDSIMVEANEYDAITEEWDKYNAIIEVLDQLLGVYS